MNEKAEQWNEKKNMFCVNDLPVRVVMLWKLKNVVLCDLLNIVVTDSADFENMITLSC